MINKALKVIRQFHKLKQVELAEKLNISKSYLSEIESGKKHISMDLLGKYSTTFDIPVSSLVFFSESLDKEGQIPEKFKRVLANKIITIMEWLTDKDESTKAKV
ncbi:conserved protein of unknown function,might belong to Transcriptional regulator [Shewanella benthica]|uniref:HTH cro/C1-type domain-containing protein n=1 Tax=Shewanella benthica TaxID=43661 RepID=A0A330M483_9GAMM|nr:helix-turn-helix transcriptional regulator [Shewanella benthica]SQH76928.1 conserved protein of unknown function,might belong to Transcriptional regulator [Shewanella benthica]